MKEIKLKIDDYGYVYAEEPDGTISEVLADVYSNPYYGKIKLGKEIDLFADLSDAEKLQADVLAKIEMLIHEAEECPEWKAKQALRCLRKELMEKLGW